MNTTIQIILLIALIVNICVSVAAQMLIARIRTKSKGRLVSSSNRLAANRSVAYTIQDLKDYIELLTDDTEIAEVKRAILLRRVTMCLMASWILAGIGYIIWIVKFVS